MNLPHIPEEPKDSDVFAVMDHLMFGLYALVGNCERTIQYAGIGWSTNGAYGVTYRHSVGEQTKLYMLRKIA